jgi:hypothetical protein
MVRACADIAAAKTITHDNIVAALDFIDIARLNAYLPEISSAG